MKLCSLITLFLICFVGRGQKIDFEGSAQALGIFSSEAEVPFWFHKNTNATVGDSTNVSVTGEFKAKYNFSESFIEAGFAGYYRDGVTDEAQRRDLYLRFQNNWLKVTLGAKESDEKLNGLSATNQNFLWSSNARPISGLLIEANNPLKISNSLGIDWGIAHYNLNDERYVDNTLVHYKRLGLHWQINEKNTLYGRLQHFVQWGGTSPDFGKLPSDFSEFMDVFVAKQSGSRNNAPGNHLGSYFLEYNLKSNVGDFSFYHEHPFEDGSGTRFANFPDGVWGIFFKPQSQKIITSVLYEYVDTTDQSGELGSSAKDSYFNNRVYKSGWAYEGRTIGLPFITIVSNSRVRIHQVGFTSTINKFNFTYKTSFVKNLGTYFVPFDPIENNIYTYFQTDYDLVKYGKISLMLGYDFSDIKKDIVGGGLSYHYSF